MLKQLQEKNNRGWNLHNNNNASTKIIMSGNGYITNDK